MANITFRSPRLGRDITVYAVAGDRGTVLAVAKAHRIPIPFDCQDGECGSCLVEVTSMGPLQRPSAMALTEKEKEMLRQLGMISREELVAAEVDDMPPRHRLACQCFVRNEDILVSFVGDETLPVERPHLSSAARVYRGGMRIDGLDEFFSYAVRVESDAAAHFDGLQSGMGAIGNVELATLFGQLARYSRLHLQSVRSRMEGRELHVEVPPDYVWPDHVTPERSSELAQAADASSVDVLRAALQGERRGHEFYLSVAATSANAAVAALATEFAREEAEHVRVLEGWLAREEWLRRNHDV